MDQKDEREGYERIVDVSLCHEYYNGSCCGFNVTPSSETAEIMRREGLLCRIYDGKVRIFAFCKPHQNVISKKMTLSFFVRASISEVWNVTRFDNVAHDELPIANVSCSNGVCVKGRKKNTLPELQQIFGVLFLLEVVLEPEYINHENYLTCTVKIPTKKLRWCYCVSGAYANKNLLINDSLKTDDPVRFECIERSSRFSLYVSQREIPIVSGAPPRFQLLDSATSKVLMKCLPNANAKSIAKTKTGQDGGSIFVAECFVNP